MPIFAFMADNYLEKRYSEVFGKVSEKKTVAHRPSLDLLLTRIASSEGFDPAYKVHKLQLEAIIASVKRLDCSGLNFSADADAQPATIRINCDAEMSGETIFRLGGIVQIMALKATEMGLKIESQLSLKNHCIIYVGKAAA